MLIQKVEKRIKQYEKFLYKNRYITVAKPDLEYTVTNKIFRTIPAGLNWKKAEIPFKYGQEWQTYWFRTRVVIPAEAAGKAVYLNADPNTDTLVFIDKKPAAGLNPFHDNILLTDKAKSGDRFLIHLEAYSGHKVTMNGLGQNYRFVLLSISKSIPDFPNTFSDLSLAIKNQAVYDLYYDVKVLAALTTELDENSLRKNQILFGLYQALMKIPVNASSEIIKQAAQECSKEIAPLLKKKNGSSVPVVYITGHAHLDHAWLWQIKETERKAARTFANMTRYFDEFKDHIFLQSQPAQLEIIKKEYPHIYQKIQKAYKDGRWEPNGCMWVEADCNIPSGESLIRQILVGNKSTREMFNYQGDTLWLPDVFGYNGNLPQILKGCEISYFITSKLSWNDTNKFPYDLFQWEGIDGSRIITQLITIGYNDRIMPHPLFESWKKVKHKEVQDAILLPVGEGDGGGGLLRSDLEQAARMHNLEGCPRIEWSTISKAMKKIISKSRNLPDWRGELYLEFHRGTFTTQARTKRYNRKLEYALRNAEFLAAVLSNSGFHYLASKKKAIKNKEIKYPAAEFLVMWKQLLTQQFHDIIPGSSIEQVYQDAEKVYEKLTNQLDNLINQYLVLLASYTASSATRESWLFLNTLSFKRTAFIKLTESKNISEKSVIVAGADKYPVQKFINFKGDAEYCSCVSIPGMSSVSCYLENGGMSVEQPFKIKEKEISTSFYKIIFDKAMRIISLKDNKTSKEYVKENSALNTIQSGEDIPLQYEAWDIESDFKLKLKDETRLVSSTILSQGPLFVQIRNKYSIGISSEMVQDLVFYAHTPRIDFITRINWKEERILLKALFPVNIHSNKVKCEIQYGHLERNTHNNLSEDRAQFEICAHKWICQEDSTHSAALLNDSKYGFDVNGSQMRISLLRSTRSPDENADKGIHFFTYSFLPSAGKFSAETVIHEAYDLNVPVLTKKMKKAQQGFSKMDFFSIDNPDIIIETVKKAEQDNALILRLYECSGGEHQAVLITYFPINESFETNMLEKNIRTLKPHNNHLLLKFAAFEIKTIKIFPGV